MRPPSPRRELRAEERAALEAGLRSPDAFVLRRCQIVLANARGDSVAAITRAVGCSDQTVLNVLHAFDARRLDVLTRRSSRPRTVHAAFTPARAAGLRDVLHHSPRAFGKPTSRWTVDGGTGRRREFRAGAHGRARERRNHPGDARAAGRPMAARQRLDHESRPGVGSEKSARARLIRLAMAHPDWALAFEDEVWWSRLAHPALHAWATPDQPTSRCGWSNRRSRRTTPTPRRWPATACWSAGGPTVRPPRRTKRRGCAS